MIAKIEYDYGNNPVRIQFTNANVTKYVYSATGEKLRVIYQTSVYPEDADIVKIGKTKELTPEEINCTETVDYLLGGRLVMRNGKIDKVLFDGGYAQASVATKTTDKFAFNFYNQDHLGNNREVVNAKGVVQQVTNYYPFGAPYADATAIKGAAVQPYKYNGKELDLMHGLNTYDYGARQHDPILARWDRIDPLCEKYYSTSPYSYCENNPVRFIDPDGRAPRIYIDGTGLGHAFVTIGEGENTVVYTYGRYGALGSSGSILRSGTPSGEGVLIKKTGKEAQKYLNEELEKGDLSVYTINNSKDENVADFFDALWDKGTHPTDEKKKSYKDPNAKVVDDYNLFSNNCTTKTISGINNKNCNTRVPTTQRGRRSYYVYPVSYSYYADEIIYDPKVLKVKLEEVSKKYPKDVIKIKDPEQFIKSLGL